MARSLSLFGSPRLRLGGHPVPLGLRRAKGLLAYLAVTERGHGRDALAALLWPDAGAGEARARLRRTVYRLNRSAGTPLVVAQQDGLAINAALELQVDVQAYRRRLAECFPVKGPAPAPDRLRRSLAEAAGLFTGDLLEGFSLPDSDAFEEWLFYQREDLRRTLSRVLDRLSELLAEVGDHDAAVLTTRRWLAMDHLEEVAHRRLMGLYRTAGQPAEALRQYAACRNLLEAELGVAPAPATERLAASIRRGPAVASSPPERPETRYVRSGDVHIAYQVLGEGGLDLVLVPGFVFHLEHIWSDPPLAAFLRSIAEVARVVLLDRRGVGLSDRVGYAPTLEHTAFDTLAVMEAVGCRPAVVMGISEGGPSSVLLTVRQPGRVRGLVLWGTTARAVRSPDYPQAVPRERLRQWIDRLVAGWGGPSAIETFAPSCADDPRTREWWAGLLRSGSSPGGVARVLRPSWTRMSVLCWPVSGSPPWSFTAGAIGWFVSTPDVIWPSTFPGPGWWR